MIESPRGESPDEADTSEPPQAPRRGSLQEPQASQAIMPVQTHANTLTVTGHAVQAPPQEPAPQGPAADSLLFVTEHSPEVNMEIGDTTAAGPIEVEPFEAPDLLPRLPPETLAEFNMADADKWLANLENNVTGDWPHDPGTVASFLTSMTTNTRTARGNIFKSYRCPEHQEVYSN
ncbi:hypothetical protein RJ035_007703 [Blastomyces gilchristii]